MNRDIAWDFAQPVIPEGLKSIQLFEKVDTNWVEVTHRIIPDSLNIRRFYLNHPWKPETDYHLLMDSATVYSIYGRFNDRLEKKFTTKALSSYGTIMINVTGVDVPVIIQLYQGDNVKVVREKWIDQGGTVTFDYLHEGKYMLRAIIDRNGNKKWDTGNFLKSLQPEEIKYLDVELELKQNFDIQQSFDVSKTYVREDPKKREKKENNNKAAR